MKPRRPLGSESFFKGRVCRRGGIFLRVAAVVVAAATLFCGTASAQVRVSGLPDWLEPAAIRSMEAVWKELEQRNDDVAERLRLLALVAKQLFAGYVVARMEPGPYVAFAATSAPAWDVAIVLPATDSTVAEWLSKDCGEVAANLKTRVAGLPVEALGWGDESLRELVRQVLAESVPGWDASPVVRLPMQSGDKGGAPRATLELRLTPRPPLMLALRPRLRSTSLPLMLRNDLYEGLIRDLAPLTGLPVVWLERHRAEVADMASRALNDRNAVRNVKASVSVAFSPEQIAPLDVRVEGRRFVLQAWASVYAGSDEMFPELGLHVGRRASPWSGWEVELYGEWLTRMNDFSVESRWGLRTSPWGDVWLGAELVYPGEILWGRVWIENDQRRAYIWWRFSEDGDNNGALGWHLTEHISLELYYDDRNSDCLVIRAIGNL